MLVLGKGTFSPWLFDMLVDGLVKEVNARVMKMEIDVDRKSI